MSGEKFARVVDGGPGSGPCRLGIGKKVFNFHSDQICFDVVSAINDAVEKAVAEERLKMARALCGVNPADARPCVDQDLYIMCPICEYAIFGEKKDERRPR